MSWHDVDAPDQVAAETGPNLATGDYTATNPDWTLADGVWSREGGGRLLLATDQWGEMAFTPDAHYEVRADVHGATAYKSLVNVDGGGGQATLPVEDPLPEILPGDGWVQVTQAGRAPTDPATGSFAIEATGPGLVQIRNPSVAVRTGRIILTVPGDVLAENIMASGGIIAGTPGGARVELTNEGLAAFDTDGTETASIAGEGGEFVGGVFRTSDNLPGRVTLSDTGFEDPLQSGIPGPGVGVTPRNPDGFTRFPGVGPSWGGMTVSGGRDATGRWATVEASPTSSTLRAVDEGGGGSGYISTAVGEARLLTSGPDGETGEVRSAPTSARLQTRATGGAVASEVNASPTAVTARTYGENGESGWMRARPGDVELAYVDSLNTYFSRIRASDTEAHLFTRAGGTHRYLAVDADGIWVKTGAKSYNLEETAQDSGWQALSLASGITGVGSPAWRNKGGVVYYRGTVTKSTGWAAGWNLLAADVTAAATPAANMLRAGVSSATNHMLLQVTSAGRLEMWLPASLEGSTTVQLSPMFYPLG